MDLFGIFKMLGGVGMFLYGMGIMSDGLKAVAGDNMRIILEKTTKNRILGTLVGFLVTALMQSSAIGIIFLSLVQTMTGCIQGYGRPVIPVLNLAAGAIVKIVVMAVLMYDPAINIQGASISTVACYAVAGILDLIYLIRVTGMRLELWDCFGKPLAASLASRYSPCGLSCGSSSASTMAITLPSVYQRSIGSSRSTS